MTTLVISGHEKLTLHIMFKTNHKHIISGVNIYSTS